MMKFKNRKLFIIMFFSFVLFSLYTLVPFAREYAIALGIAAFALMLILGEDIAKRIHAKNIVFILLAALFAASSILYAKIIFEKCTLPQVYVDGEEHIAEATITKVSYSGAYSSSYYVNITSIDGEEVDFDVVLEIEEKTEFEYGNKVSFSAEFSNTTDETAYLKGKRIFFCAQATTADVIGVAEKDMDYYIHTANEYFCKRFVSFLGEDEGGFCAALILGNRTYVSQGLRLDFSRIGISHLLALSGLHLSIVVQALDFLLRGAVGKKYRNIILIAASWGFALFTGLSFSVMRAAIMMTAVYLADILGEQNDSITSISAAVFIITLFEPTAVYDIGFWLSASATLGIILIRPAADELFYKWRKPKKRKLLRALYAICKYFYGIFSMSLAAFIFTLPAIYFSFGEVSMIGLVSNFVFLPLASCLLVMCFLFVPLSFVPYASGMMTFICKKLAFLIMSLAQIVADMRNICVSLKYPFSGYVFAALAVCLIACIFINKLTWKKVCAMILSFCVAFFACFGVYSHITENEEIYSVATYRSGEFVSFASDGESYAIDISTGKYSIMREALFSVKEFGFTEVDNLILTHYHQYHKNSIERLSDLIKIRKVMLPSFENETEEKYYNALVQLLVKLDISFEVYERGNVWSNGEVKIDIAPLYKLSRSDKPIVAFSVETRNSSFSYIESAAFEGISDISNRLDSDVVFIGAHGPNRKFKVSAAPLSFAGRVIFCSGSEEFFRESELPQDAYFISESDGVMDILYKNE